MAKLYVPIISDDSELYKVETVENDNSFSINGIAKGSSRYNIVEELVNKLRILSNDRFYSIKIRGAESNSKFNSFSHSTDSINLGVFLSLYARVNKFNFDGKYETITISGNFSVEDNNRIQLKSVIEIPKKFEITKKYTSQFPENRHLFLYVNDDDQMQIPEGWHDNLFVIAFSSEDSIENVFAEVFDFSIHHWKEYDILNNNNYANEYIETPSFLKWKKQLCKDDCNGFLITGSSNSGKSIATVNLCKYLLKSKIVDDIVWISIFNNRHFWDEITKMSGSSIFLENNVTNVIRKLFPDEFSKLNELLQIGKKACFVIDNIEGKYVDKIFEFINEVFKTNIITGHMKILITSWYGVNDETLMKSLKISEKSMETLKLTQHEYNLIFDSVLNLSGNGNAFYSESELLQNEFKELLYELYEQGCKNRKSQPGLINRAIAPLYKRKLQDLINRYKSEDVKNLTPEAKSNRIDFEECDLLSQLVLFAFIGINNYWQEIEYEEICSILYDKVFNQTIAKSYLINEKNLRDSFRILIQKKLVNDEKNIYSVKEDVIRFCILSNAENKELSKEFLKVRDELISKNTKIDYTIQNGFFEEYKKFIQEYDDKEGINHFLIQCVQYDKGIEYLQPLVDKGINPDYLDQDGQSPLDVLWVRDTNLKVMEFLLAQGFKFRNKIPCHDRAGNKFSYSPLVLVSDKCNPKWVKIILKNHIYEDINDYEFQGRFTALQLYVIGSSLEAVSLLIQAGADFLLNTKDGWSLLILAVMNDKHPEILEYLLKNGFHGEFHYKDDKGKTAMDYAKQIKNQKAIELLEKYEKLQNNS